MKNCFSKKRKGMKTKGRATLENATFIKAKKKKGHHRSVSDQVQDFAHTFQNPSNITTSHSIMQTDFVNSKVFKYKQNPATIPV